MRVLTLLLALSITVCSCSTHDLPPETPRQDTIRQFHGVKVREPYAWLESMHEERVLAWAKEQDGYARAQVDPGEAASIRDQILKVTNVTRYFPPLARGEKLFYVSANAAASNANAWLRRDGHETDQLIVDGEELERENLVLTRQLWPSPDGEYLAYGVTRPGSRWMTIRILETRNGETLTDNLEGLVAFSSTLSWAANGKGFYYERFELPAEEERLSARLRREEVRFHQIGDRQQDDTLIFEPKDPDNDVLSQTLSDDGRFLVIGVRDGRADNNHLFVRPTQDTDAEFLQLTRDLEANFSFVGSSRDELWIQTDLDAPRGRVVSVDFENTQRENWNELVPEQPDATIDTWVGAKGIAQGLVIGYRIDSRLVFEYRDSTGALLRTFEPPNLGSVWTGFYGQQRDPRVFFVVSSFADPGTVYGMTLPEGDPEIFLRPELPYDPDEIVVEQWFFKSPARDRQPMFVAYHRGTPPDGKRPIMMYGYGTGGWIAAPWFRAYLPYWFKHGGAFALPALRGGGEYGEPWRLAGARTNKENSIADYIAAAEWLVETGRASPATLIAETNSAGGPIVGASILRRPDLFGAAILSFPLLDMLGYEKFTHAGRWRSSFGTVADSTEFVALHEYSPVHNVMAGKCYPPTLIAPGARDEITPPVHAYKFTAALQHAQNCDNPVLMRIAWNAGHAYGGDPEETASAFAHQLLFLDTVMEAPE